MATNRNLPAIVSLGYICPNCETRVVVLRSSDPPMKCPAAIFVRCTCGHTRYIGMDEIQSLEVWREKPKAA